MQGEEIMERDKTELEKRNILRLSNAESHKLTKECIQTALIELMTKKQFKDITISEVIIQSGISRSAFYRNYSSKEDIVKEICGEIFGFIKEYVSTEYVKDNSYNFFFGIFSAVKENEDRIRLLFKANIHQILPSIAFADNIREELWSSNQMGDCYRNLAIEGAFNMILIDWFKKGMKESVEYMAQFCADLTQRIKEW